MAWGKPNPDIAPGARDAPPWLDAIEKNDEKLTSLHVLRVREFDEALQVATAKALETNTHLEHFYASGHRVSMTSAHAWAASLAVNETLKSLCIGDDAFGTATDAGDGVDGKSALEATLRGVAHSSSLELLDLEYKGVTDASAEALGKALMQCATLREIRLGRNTALSGAGLTKALAGAVDGGSLEVLDLSDSALENDGANAVRELLASSCPVQALGLTRCALAHDGLQLIGAGVASCATLRRLDMSGVKLGGGGAVACFGGAHFTDMTTKLSEIELVECGVCDEEDIKALNAFLCSTPHSSVVNLRGNAFGDSGLEVFASGAFSARAPHFLDLGSCGLTPRAVDALKVPLATSTSLSLFDNPKLGDEGVGRLFSAAESSSVTCLDLGAVGLTAVGLKSVLEALKNPKTFENLRTFVIGGNPGAQDDEWEQLVNNLRTIRPCLDVAWRAADGGDSEKLQRDAQGRVIGVDPSQGLP